MTFITGRHNLTLQSSFELLR